MRKYQKWLVVVDDIVEQSAYLKNVSQLADQFLPTQIRFCFPIGKSDLPKELVKDLDLDNSSRKEREVAYNQEILKGIINQEHRFELELEEENWLPAVLKNCNQFQPELVLACKGNQDKPLLNTQKLVRKSSCSVLLLENQKVSIDKISAHIDMTSYSDLAVAFLKEVQEFSPLINLELVHSYKGASQYLHQLYERPDDALKAAVKESRIEDALKTAAQLKIKEFSKSVGLSAASKRCVSYADVETKIRKVAKAFLESQADLIVIGSKGKEATNVDLLSPLTDGLLQSEVLSNVLILKEKGENKGLLKALLKLLN